jgi:hypothetical protein
MRLGPDARHEEDLIPLVVAVPQEIAGMKSILFGRLSGFAP